MEFINLNKLQTVKRLLQLQSSNTREKSLMMNESDELAFMKRDEL